MKQELAKHLSDGAVVLATSTGTLTVILKFLDNYAAGIGALCTIIFGLVYILFQFLAHKKLTLADENKKNHNDLAAAFVDHKTDTNAQFKHVNNGLDEIKELLK